MSAPGSDYRWSADGKTLLVVVERRRLEKVAVTTALELSLSAPTVVQELEKLKAAM